MPLLSYDMRNIMSHKKSHRKTVNVPAFEWKGKIYAIAEAAAHRTKGKL